MKVLFVCGSPRRHGNTTDVMRMVADEVAERYDVEFTHLAGDPIHGCRGCRHCWNNVDEPGCCQKDKISGLLDKVLEADVLVYGSPCYGHSFSAEMNAFMNRHFALLKYLVDEDPWARNKGRIQSLVEGKKAGFIGTCQGPVEGNADLLLLQFDRFCDRLQLDPFGKYIFPWASWNAQEAHWSKDGIRRIVDDVEQIAQYL